MKDQTQTATFIYQAQALDSSTDLTLAQDNSYGAQGYAYWGWLSNTVSNAGAWYFVKASNCSDWMCTAPNPTAMVIYAMPLQNKLKMAILPSE